MKNSKILFLLAIAAMGQHFVIKSNKKNSQHSKNSYKNSGEQKRQEAIIKRFAAQSLQATIEHCDDTEQIYFHENLHNTLNAMHLIPATITKDIITRGLNIAENKAHESQCENCETFVQNLKEELSLYERFINAGYGDLTVLNIQELELKNDILQKATAFNTNFQRINQ